MAANSRPWRYSTTTLISGDVYVFNVGAFQLVPGVINKDYILKNLPDQPGKRLTQLGAVESIHLHTLHVRTLLWDESLKHSGLSHDPNDLYSDKEWPMGGGQCLPPTTAPPDAKVDKDLLLTGHEDGSVRFWNVTNISITIINRLRTSEYLLFIKFFLFIFMKKKEINLNSTFLKLIFIR